MKKQKNKIPVTPDYGAVEYLQVLFNELIEQLCGAIDRVEALKNKNREELKR